MYKKLCNNSRLVGVFIPNYVTLFILIYSPYLLSQAQLTAPSAPLQTPPAQHSPTEPAASAATGNPQVFPSRNCGGEKIIYSLPLRSEDQGKTWSITNFVDLDPRPGQKLDFLNNKNDLARTYDGHDGIDFGIANFRKMDQGIPVMATADGLVEVADDGYFDREVQHSTRKSNMIVLRHSNGQRTGYGHLRKNSLKFKVGDTVRRGEEIGLIGSSGDSTGPHLHFEVWDCNHRKIDPFQLNLVSPLPLATHEPTILDFAVSNERNFNEEKSSDLIANLKTNNYVAHLNQKVFIVFWVAELIRTSQAQIEAIQPNGQKLVPLLLDLTNIPTRHPFIGALPSTLTFPTPGMWSVGLRLNGKKIKYFQISVRK